MLWHSQIKCYLSFTNYQKIIREVDNSYPQESGGVLMGYWGNYLKEVAITHIIGPGPNAEHGNVFFRPDYKWQEDEIKIIYQKTDRKITYLGDWHSHPNASAALSFKDRFTLLRIAKYLPARAPHPLMGIVDGKDTFHIWCLMKQNIIFPFVKKQRLICINNSSE